MSIVVAGILSTLFDCSLGRGNDEQRDKEDDLLGDRLAEFPKL